MSRKDFQEVRQVPLDDILLDVENARIRAGKDQADCVARIFRKEEQLLALMENIAIEGLTTVPILVSPTDDGRWIVRDGNRRVTALKLLNNPDLAPDQRARARIRTLAKTHGGNIDDKLDVLASSNEAAILREVVARHSGAQGGIGQLNWSAYLRTVYLMNHGHPAEYKRAAQYVFWAEEQGVSVEDEFPITNVHRFFSKENLEALGFKIVADDLQPVLPTAQAKAIAQRVITDFQLRYKNVDDVRSPAQAEQYILAVRNDAGLPPPVPKQSAKSAASQAPQVNSTSGAVAPNTSTAGPRNGDPSPRSPFGATATATSSGGAPSARTPRKAAADRKCIFGSRSPALGIPDTEVKAVQIVTELRRLDVRETPLAGIMLLRALIEASTEHYRKRHRISDTNALAKNVAGCALRMQSKAQLDNAQFDIVNRLAAKGGSDLLTIEALQKMLHRDTHIPDYLIVNTFWDNISDFVRACWSK